MSIFRFPILAKGEFPHAAGVVQVVDDDALDAVASQEIPEEGLLLDFDHYSDLTEDERGALAGMGILLPSDAAGWIHRLWRDGDKVFAEADLTPSGAEKVSGKEYRYASPVFDYAGLQGLGGNRVRPLHVEKVGLTNEPNMKAIGAIIANRSSYALANSDDDVEWRMIGGHPVPIKDGQPALEGEKSPSGRVDMTEAESEKYKKEHPVSGWKADKDPGECSPEDARRMLEDGIDAESPFGKSFQLDWSIVRHWENNGYTTGQIDARLCDFYRCKFAIESPHEVWDDGRGTVFLQLISDDGGKTRFTNVFAYEKTSKVASFYHYNGAKKFERHRKGKLIYSKLAPAAGIHPGASNRGAPDAGTALGESKRTTETLEVKRLDIEAITEGAKMELEKLVEILGCEATEEAILAAIKSLKSAMAEEKPEEEEPKAEEPAEEAKPEEDEEKKALKNRAESAEAALEALKAKIAEDLLNAKVAEELAKHPALQNREAGAAALKADFESVSAILAEMDRTVSAPAAGMNPEHLENRAGETSANELTGIERLARALAK